MKYIMLSLVLTLLCHNSSACSCDLDFEHSFFRNARQANTCLAVCDTVYVAELPQGSSWTAEENVGFFRVISSMQSTNVEAEQYIAVLGHDGINCGAYMSNFTPGDTAFLSISIDWQYDPPVVPPNTNLEELHYLQGLCGHNFLIIENGEYCDLSISDVTKRLELIWDYSELQADCIDQSWSPLEEQLALWDEYCLARYLDFDYSYSFEGMTSQTGKVVVLDNYGSNEYEIGDTLVMIGDDGLNCGESLQLFEAGDSLLVNMKAGYHESFVEDTFLLQGGCCGSHYMEVHGNMAQFSNWAERPLTEVLHMLKDPPFPFYLNEIGHLTIPVEMSIPVDSMKKSGSYAIPHSRLQVRIWPNPTSDQLMFDSRGQALSSIQIFNIQGVQVHQWTAEETMSSSSTDISHLSPGIYHVRVTTQHGSEARKIVKQ